MMVFGVMVYFSASKKEFLRTLSNGAPTTTAKATRANLSTGYTRNMLVHILGYASTGIEPRG